MLVHNQNVRVLISVVVRVRYIVIKVEEEVSGKVPGKGWGQPREIAGVGVREEVTMGRI